MPLASGDEGRLFGPKLVFLGFGRRRRRRPRRAAPAKRIKIFTANSRSLAVCKYVDVKIWPADGAAPSYTACSQALAFKIMLIARCLHASGGPLFLTFARARIIEQIPQSYPGRGLPTYCIAAGYTYHGVCDRRRTFYFHVVPLPPPSSTNTRQSP